MAHTGRAAARATESTTQRYRRMYETAQMEASEAVEALRLCLWRGADVKTIAAAAHRAQFASARLYTAAACILSPP